MIAGGEFFVSDRPEGIQQLATRAPASRVRIDVRIRETLAKCR
jgi:hypothetical protein